MLQNVTQALILIDIFWNDLGNGVSIGQVHQEQQQVN